MDSREISLLRIVAQRLTSVGRPLSPVDAVARLGCVQGQDLTGAIESVALRSSDTAGVREALASGAIVRTWTMRGTLHLALASDVRWMLSLTQPRQDAAAAARHRVLEIDETVIERAWAAIESRFGEAGQVGSVRAGGQAHLTRAEIMDAFAADGLNDRPQRGIHLIGILARRALIVQGPPHPRRPSEQLFVRGTEWLPPAPTAPRDELVRGWLRTYLVSHGPAPISEFARWTALTLGDSRRAWETLRDDPALTVFDVDSVPYVMAADLPDRLASCRAEARGRLFLPGFDELLLGYLDRTPTLAPEHAHAVCPGGNGMFRNTVVDDGRVIGTWTRAKAGPAATLFSAGS